jgi:hypothetical protein
MSSSQQQQRASALAAARSNGMLGHAVMYDLAL